MVGLGKQITITNGVQTSLINGGPPLHTALFAGRGDFDALFQGFERLRAVSYVASPELLLDFLIEGRFSQIEIVVGENLSQRYKEALVSRRIEVVEALTEKIADGSLRILVPRRTIHSKLYILEKPGMLRVINGSPNLTETAQEASKQINYVWYLDVLPGDPLAKTFTEDYEAHCKYCSPFMGDLIELIRKNARDIPKQQVITAWLTAAGAREGPQGAVKILEEITAHALEPVPGESQPVFSLKLPDAPTERREAQKVLAKLGVKTVGDVVEVDRRAYFNYVEKTINVPLMAVDVVRGQVRLAIDGSLHILNEALPEPEAMDRALTHLERYINTVELGRSLDPGVAKTAIFEALLYFLAAPFANEHMKIMRRSFGVQTSRRGPKWLYLCGPSSNGKSVFFQFALPLLTGRPTKALEATTFTRTRLKNAMALGTCFPLVFDDVKTTQQSAFEAVKSYWEAWWSPDRNSPQVIVSSNDSSLKEWAKSRVKRVDFNVHFTENAHNNVVLKEILEEPNPVFRWFSTLYLSKLKQTKEPHDDELRLARDVMQDLYSHAGRDLPPFFPNIPLELIHDPGRSLWRELFRHGTQATFKTDHKRLIVDFREDLQHSDLRQYDAALPQLVKWERRGRRMTVDNPGDFFNWLGEKPPARLGALGRLFGIR